MIIRNTQISPFFSLSVSISDEKNRIFCVCIFFICFFSLLFYVPNAVSDSLCNSGRKFEYFMHKMQNHTIPKKTYRYGYMLLTFWSKKNRKLKKKKWILPMVWTRSIPTYCLTYWSFFPYFLLKKKRSKEEMHRYTVFNRRQTWHSFLSFFDSDWKWQGSKRMREKTTQRLFVGISNVWNFEFE